MSRVNTVLIHDSDGRFYVTLETAGRRRWYRVWQDNYVLAETVRVDVDELRDALLEARLDPAVMREPTEEEKRPRPPT